MKILLVGNGGREHAIAWRLRESPSVKDIICPNGNPGIARLARSPRMALKTNAEWVALAREEMVDLVVVGPEGPLEEGLADAMAAQNIPVFGPVKEGARLEFSKSHAKEVMQAAGIPTAAAETFEDADAAKDYARSLGLPVVIKADGLAAGKGVTVANTWEDVERAIDENLRGLRFGAASTRVLVEEYMEGEEASIFGLCDGNTVVPLAPAQDHKRVFDGDLGPNTGGMGAYAPTPAVNEEIFAAAFSDILRPTLEHLKSQGIVFRGVLYAGLMLTKSGPKVVEFNCRFGDPETQVVLPLLEGDFGEILMACATGKLAGTSIVTRPDHATTVVLSSGGYPGDYETGFPITGLEAWDGVPNAMIFHAGTKADSDGRVLTAGGRVLACTAWDRTLARSQERAYAMAESVNFTGRHFRRDIAHRALKPRN